MQHGGTVPAVLTALPGNLPVWVVKCVHYAMYYHFCRARWGSKVQRSVIHSTYPCSMGWVCAFVWLCVWERAPCCKGQLFPCVFIFRRIRHVDVLLSSSPLCSECYCVLKHGGGGIRCVSLPCLCMKAHVYARQRCSALLFCLPIPCSFSMSVEKTWNEILKAATFKMPCCFGGVF